MPRLVCVNNTLSLRFLQLSYENLIDVAPTPALPSFERLYYGMASVAKMLRGVLSGRRVATPDVATYQAHAQTDPELSDL
jgi:hypothetical protein